MAWPRSVAEPEREPDGVFLKPVLRLLSAYLCSVRETFWSVWIGEIGEVVQSMPQEDVRNRTVAIPVPQILKEFWDVVQNVSPRKIARRIDHGRARSADSGDSCRCGHAHARAH